MAQNISLLGATYSAVPAVDLPKQGGGTARFTDVTDTTAAASDVASGKYFYTAAGVRTAGTASGGGIGTLLATKSLGTISTSSTSETDTGQTVTVSSINSYDLFIVETSVNTVVANRHMATVAGVELTNSTDVSTKDSTLLITQRMNFRMTSANKVQSRAGTNAYGIYPKTVTLSSGNATISMYQRYNNTYTGTINGSYTVRVYGINLYSLIGG